MKLSTEHDRRVRAAAVEHAIWRAIRSLGESEISVLTVGLCAVTKRVAEYGLTDESNESATTDQSGYAKEPGQ